VIGVLGEDQFGAISRRMVKGEKWAGGDMGGALCPGWYEVTECHTPVYRVGVAGLEAVMTASLRKAGASSRSRWG